MKIYRDLILVLMVQLSYVGVTCAQPILMASNSAGETYANPENLKRDPFGFSLVLIFHPRTGSMHSSGREVRSIEFSYSVKCAEQVQKMTRAVSFSEQWTKGAVLNTAPPPDEWEKIDNGSVIKNLHVALCK